MLSKHIHLGIIILLFFLIIPQPAIAQESTDSVRVSINAQDMTLQDVLSTIEDKSAMSFAYNPNHIPTDRVVSLKVENQPLDEVLALLLDPIGIEYLILEKQIILKKPTATDRVLHGYVIDQKNGEALIGALIYDSSSQSGTNANAFGYFSLALSSSVEQLTISYVGYEYRTLFSNEMDTSEPLTIELVESPSVLDELIISADSIDRKESLLSPAYQTSVKELVASPSLLGESDVIKTMESVPGIKMHADGSTFFYVRGGHKDQNLIMVDDAPVFNPSHLLGFFSSMIPESINSINIYKGNMPASLGGKLSSIIDIRTKKGNNKRFSAWGSTGIVSSKLGVEGPIKREFSSFLLSARLSQVKWLLEDENSSIDRLRFYDITGKVNFKLNNRNTIYASYYGGSDDYFEDNSGIEWSNNAGAIRWNHLFSDRLFLNTTLTGSDYTYFLHTDLNTNTKWKSRIANISLKGDLTYFRDTRSTYQFGVALNGYNFNPGNLRTDAVGARFPLLSVKNVSELVLYGGHEFQLSGKFKLDYGLRLSAWTNVGSAFEYVFDDFGNAVDTLFYEAEEDYHTYATAEPRLALSYLIDDRQSIQIGLNRNVQNLHLLSNSISPFNSVEVWVPSSPLIRPQASLQANLTYTRHIADMNTTLSADLYYKSLSHQVDYADHAGLFLSPLYEGQLRFGNGKSYGIELQARKQYGKVTGHVSYVLSRAERQIEGINRGNTYRTFQDRPHDIDISASYQVNERIKLSTHWAYYTGAPFSSPSGFFLHNGLEVPIYAERNNDRLPDYHRLDASVNYQINRNSEAKFRHELNLTIYNLYSRKNILFINHNKVKTNDNEFRVASNLLNKSKVTSQFYLFGFIPSLTYKFYIQ